jgi:hypothetical protein
MYFTLTIAVFEVDVRIVLERQPRVVRYNPTVVYVKVHLPSTQSMHHTGISSSVSGVAIVVDNSYVVELLRKLLRALFAVHAGRILVDGSARTVNHVCHDNVIKPRMGRSVGDFSADGQIDIFDCRRRIPFVDPEKHVAVRKPAFLKFDDMNPRGGEPQHLTLFYIFDQLELLLIIDSRYHIGSI